MNSQPAALDNGGQITDIVIITSGLVAENFGRPLNVPFMGIIRCVAGCGKPFALPTADAFEAALRDYNPPSCTVVGAVGEEDFVVELQAAINRRLHIQSSGVKP